MTWIEQLKQRKATLEAQIENLEDELYQIKIELREKEGYATLSELGIEY